MRANCTEGGGARQVVFILIIPRSLKHYVFQTSPALKYSRGEVKGCAIWRVLTSPLAGEV